MTTPSYWSAIRMIKEQPIAYNVEKVVEQAGEIDSALLFNVFAYFVS